MKPATGPRMAIVTIDGDDDDDNGGPNANGVG